MPVTTPALDARQHHAAIAALLNASLSPRSAYTFDKVPGSSGSEAMPDDPSKLPKIYAAFSVERRFVPIRRGAVAAAGRSSWRVSVRFVGEWVAQAAWCEHRVALALNEALLIVDGHTSTPIQHETTTAMEKDKLRWSGLSSWTYTV